MVNDYLFGRTLTKGSYQALRSLAQKLSYKEFHKSTGFGHGIHNRLRRFPAIERYWAYIKANREKYSPRIEKKRITLQEVYAELLEIKKMLSK